MTQLLLIIITAVTFTVWVGYISLIHGRCACLMQKNKIQGHIAISMVYEKVSPFTGGGNRGHCSPQDALWHNRQYTVMCVAPDEISRSITDA
jgi:hypothetical protein